MHKSDILEMNKCEKLASRKNTKLLWTVTCLFCHSPWKVVTTENLQSSLFHLIFHLTMHNRKALSKNGHHNHKLFPCGDSYFPSQKYG